MSQFGIKLSLPPVEATDVATRELSITVGANAPTTVTLTGQPIESDEIVFNADDEVSVVLVDVDGHNNRSQPSAPFTFKVLDDVAPPQPGTVGIAAKRQLP